MCDMGKNRTNRRCRAVTLVECVIAAAMLSLAVVGLASSLGSSVGNIDRSAKRLEAARLAERLIDEITTRPVASMGGQRSNWGVEDYHGLYETPGTLTEASGKLCVPRDQIYTRRASVEPCHLPDLSGGTQQYAGRRVTVHVESPDDWTVSLTRCVPLAEVVP